MSGTVELPDDVYVQLQAAAAAAGTTPAEWIAARLPRGCQESGTADSQPHRSCASDDPAVAPPDAGNGAGPQQTLADRLAGRIGRLSSGRTDLSERVSEIFLEGLLEKKRTGRL
ncbi:MAG TPA: hypothetical protein VF541_20370 [Longimicrobium sp.]|jgi:hypothetical protein